MELEYLLKLEMTMGSLDIGANILIERAWKEWSNLGNCTANGRLSFLDCQKIFVETLCRGWRGISKKN